MIKLSQTRGDTAVYKFQRKDSDGEIITTRPDSIFFTVKKSFKTPAIILQKTIDQMEMEEDGTWHFTVESFDTSNLDYGAYVFDIQVTDNSAVTTIAKGTLTLTEEATWE